jgi:SAM-dependent methyltransferase
MARHAYAAARFHLVLECLLSVTGARGTMLDIGCASGYYSVAFARAGGRATGVDISPSSIALARRRAKREGVEARCEFATGDIRSLPFSDRAFDAVLMVEVLEHVREQRQALAEGVRTLRPGGMLVLATPHAFDLLPGRQRFRHRRAATPESAGVTVERLGTNPSVDEAGIHHEPYFHDAFTFEEVRTLLPADLDVIRLHSLTALASGLRLSRHVPQTLRERIKRSLAPTASTTTATGPADSDEPLDLPPLGGDAALIVKASKIMWQVPVVREMGSHVLLVAHRRPSG